MIPIDLLIDRGAVLKDLELGEIIYSEGARAQHYYQVVTGRVRISNYLEDGKEVLHKIVAANECFGEISIFEGEHHIATAVADSSCRLLKISTTVFLEILEEFPQLHGQFVQLVAKDLRFKMFLTKLIHSGCPETILMDLLQYLNKNRKLVCQECNRLMLTRQQLANMTGMRVETVIRTMKQLEKEDKLNIVRGKVFVPADGLE